MTSNDFIQKYYTVNDGKERRYSSIYKDEQGNIYSYGKDYPLVFQVRSINGQRLNFINIMGYSTTTSKHINYAYSLTSTTYFEFYNVKLPFQCRNFDIEIVTKALINEIQELNELMTSKKIKNTMIYRTLEGTKNDRIRTLKMLMI